MPELTKPPKPYGSPSRGVSGADVDRAADQLLRTGERPTVEKIRTTLGTGSPNTINPLLDAWWKRLASRLDAGPAALHRLPESVAHVAEALWMQALDEGRRRAQMEIAGDKRAADQAKDAYEVRAHVLTLREAELDTRLRDRERGYAELQAQLRTLTILLQKEQKSREAQTQRIAELEAQLTHLRAATAPRVRKPRASPPKSPPLRPAAKKRPITKQRTFKRAASKSAIKRRKR
jgi:hypothetical protein